MGAKDILEEQKRRAHLEQAEPIIGALAGHIRHCFTTARVAREQTIEIRLFKSLRQRRGEYDPEKLTEIRKSGGSEVYMMLTANKCRGASAWLRDIMNGNGAEKPWTIEPTPVPNLSPDMVAELRQKSIAQVTALMQATNQVPKPWEMRDIITEIRSEYMDSAKEEAKFKCMQMEDKMEDQLEEGGFRPAMDDFIDDFVTFPAAALKGPVIRNKNTIQWAPSKKAGYQLTVKKEFVLEWERVDPFMMYPSPDSADVDDGYFIERHKLRQEDLEALIGVEGYDDGAIRCVLDDYGRGGLKEWLIVDSSKALAEGKSTTAIQQNTEHTIDALQFWGTVPGQMLLDWGLDDKQVPDPVTQYHIEAWLIGKYIIKAALNADPLGRKPYFKACYENVPGSFWGNAPPDLMRDCQDICNAAARATANNMAIASGPQVWINTDRVAPGEDIEQVYPWKIWQTVSDPMGSTAPPAEFFQPQINVQQLMMVYDKFSVLADEYCSIPRYMTGDSPVGGAGRTASGMSMLMNNAGKSMKQVLANVDAMMCKLLDRLYFYNMKFSDDPELKGDISVSCDGASGVAAREAAQVRRNEFLMTVLQSPMATQIVGTQGVGALLRESAKTLDMNPDEIVPSVEKLKLMQMAINAQQAQQAAQVQQQADSGQPSPLPGAPGQAMPSQPAPVQNGQVLQNGSPITDNFS